MEEETEKKEVQEEVQPEAQAPAPEQPAPAAQAPAPAQPEAASQQPVAQPAQTPAAPAVQNQMPPQGGCPGSRMMNIEPKDIPRDLVRFMLIDPAGDDDENKSQGDDWAVWVIGVDPRPNERGIMTRYILNGFLDKLTESAAPELIGRIFMDNGPIMKTGYEYSSEEEVKNDIDNPNTETKENHIRRDVKIFAPKLADMIAPSKKD